MSSLIVIPARGGSKGVPKKNVRLLGGKPLTGYTIEVALKVARPEDICVTTDDDEVMAIARGYGLTVPFRRPAELSTDEASQYDVVRHAFMHYHDQGISYDNVVLLQPTTPFRKTEEIREQIARYSPEVDMVVSVCRTAANPYFVLFEEDDNGFLHKSKEGSFKRRQECPDVWQYNGSCYVINPASLLRHNLFSEFSRVIKYEMLPVNSVDIDDEMDWLFCEFLIEKGFIGETR